MTIMIEPTTLASILAEGRAKLEHLRLKQDDRDYAEAQDTQARAEDHWQALRKVAWADMPTCLWPFTNLVTRPAHWQCDSYHLTTSFALVIRPPGFAPVLGAYRYDRCSGAWRRRSFDGFRRKSAWAVPMRVLGFGRDGGGRYASRGDDQSWHYTDDLALALAVAEQEGINLANLEIEAANLDRQRQEEKDRAARCKPLFRTVHERLEELIIEITSAVVSERQD